MSFLEKLFDISKPISEEPSVLPIRGELLSPLYRSQNGALAFESSLLVLPTLSVHHVPSLQEWNEPTGWRRGYSIPDDVVFFGMDVFAGQFGIGPGGVVRFDPETGCLSTHSNDLEQWAATILDDYDYETGFSVAHEWQARHGSLSSGMRLLPKKPFVLGGEYSVENMIRWPVRDSLEQFSGLCRQVSDLPDGQPVTVTGWLVQADRHAMP